MIFAADIETAPIIAGLPTPPVACMSVAGQGDCRLYSPRDAIAKLRPVLAREDVTIVWHNGAYDLTCLAAEAGDEDFLRLIFNAYAAGRVRDTMIRQMLADIAAGDFRFREGDDGTEKVGYGLDDLAMRHLRVAVSKDNAWRMNYHDLVGVALDRWPTGAVSYAKNDADVTLPIFHAQEQAYAERGWLVDEIPQVQAAFALQLMHAWGVRTDSKAIAQLQRTIEAKKTELFFQLVKDRLIAPSGKRNTRVAKDMIIAAYRELGLTVPTTDGGDVSTAEDTIEKTGHPKLLKLVEYAHTQKLETTYLVKLKWGEKHPINANFKVLVASGRTSCSGPNLQNPPRLPGVRECYVPRPGFLYCSVDYNFLELCTLAQACIDLVGYSVLGDTINAGKDPHVKMASEILNISYEEGMARKKSGDAIFKEIRILAKQANFGLGGGMGAEKFVFLCRQQDIHITVEEARRLKAAWLKAWPEMTPYFEHIAQITRGNTGTLRQLRSGRLRGNVYFTEAANSYFQGLAADGAKAALWIVSRECYVEPTSPLYGSRPVIFAHDEIIAEVPEWRAHEAAMRLSEVMVGEMKRYVPNVKIAAEPCLMRRWQKTAEAAYDNNKRLIAYEDRVQSEAA